MVPHVATPLVAATVSRSDATAAIGGAAGGGGRPSLQPGVGEHGRRGRPLLGQVF